MIKQLLLNYSLCCRAARREKTWQSWESVIERGEHALTILCRLLLLLQNLLLDPLRHSSFLQLTHQVLQVHLPHCYDIKDHSLALLLFKWHFLLFDRARLASCHLDEAVPAQPVNIQDGVAILFASRCLKKLATEVESQVFDGLVQ